MDDSQLLRYSRHILLRQVDIAGQEKLLHARVLIIGLGGLGSPVAMYLAASGVGQLVIVDHDKVELTNLQRQIVHTTASIGESKATSATRQLKALNPDITITAINRKLDEAELLEQVRAADVVVDASDNFATRFAINTACVKVKKTVGIRCRSAFRGPSRGVPSGPPGQPVLPLPVYRVERTRGTLRRVRRARTGGRHHRQYPGG